VTAFCEVECTEDNYTIPSVQAFASNVHAHQKGIAIKMRHIRDGVELEPLAWNEHYDFNFQQGTTFQEEVTIYPGDLFIVECTYDTTGEDDMTLFAESTSDEMCSGGVSIYPVPDWDIGCTMDLADSAVNQWLDDAYDAGLWDVDHNGLTIEDLMDSGNITDPSDVHPRVWEQYGGHWNKEHEDAATFYDKLWNDPAYGERLSLCSENMNIITFEEEYGEFEEYCMDSCLCGETNEDTKGSNGLVTWKIAVIVVAAVAAVCLFGIAFCFCVARQLSKESVPQNDNDYVSGDEVEEASDLMD